MKYRKLGIATVIATVTIASALALWMFNPRVVSAEDDEARSLPIYNPYPPGILPPNLNSEIKRVLREIDFIEARAIARWKALMPPTLTNQPPVLALADRKSTRLNSSHRCISYAVFCLKKKTNNYY